MKKTTLFAVASLALIVCACAKKKAPVMSYPPTPAVLAKAESRTVKAYISTLGTTSSKCSVNIVPQVSGQIVEIKFRQGDPVKAGQILAVIDKRPFEAAVKEAEGNLRQCKAQLKIDELQVERNRKLAKDDYVDKQTFDAQLAQVEVDKGKLEACEAALDTAKINLGWCDVKAPVDGKLGLYNINVGNVVGAGTSIITTIEHVDNLYVDFVIPSQRLSDVRKLMVKNGGKLGVIVKYIEDDFAKYQRRATVDIILNKIRYETGTAIFRGIIENNDSLFWPDQSVSVTLELEDIKDAVLVPDIALQTNAVGPFLYVATSVGGGVYRIGQVQVEKGQLFDGKDCKMRLVKGIKGGDNVVLDVSNLRLQMAGPYVYAATRQGAIIGADGKVLTTPDQMKKFLTESAQIAGKFRAEFAKKAAAEAAKPTLSQQVREATRAATTPVPESGK